MACWTNGRNGWGKSRLKARAVDPVEVPQKLWAKRSSGNFSGAPCQLLRGGHVAQTQADLLPSHLGLDRQILTVVRLLT